MLSPGIEFHIHPVKIYADAEFPVFQHFTGNQLAAPVLVQGERELYVLILNPTNNQTEI